MRRDGMVTAIRTHDMSGDRQTIAQMSSEFLRELGVLFVAFGPLDYMF